MISKKNDKRNARHQHVQDHLEKELAKHKPAVRMDESFRIGLKNELLAEYTAKQHQKSKKPVLSAIPEFFSRGWVKGMAGVLAVVVISAVTVYVNRAQFLSRQAPVESQENALPGESNLPRAGKNPATQKAVKEEFVQHAKKDEGLRQEKKEKPAGVLSTATADSFGPAGQLEDDKAAAKSKTLSAPSPVTKLDENRESEKKESGMEMQASPPEDRAAGVSMARKSTESPSVTLQYRFGGRPDAFDDIDKTLRQDRLPAKSSVAIDELVNAFSYGDKVDPAEPLSIVTELAVCPWNDKNLLILVALDAGTLFDNNTAVAENTGMKVRFYGSAPVQNVPAGSYYYITVHSPSHAPSPISGTILSGEQSTILIELPFDGSFFAGQIVADGTVAYRKYGETVERSVPFAVTYRQKPGEPASGHFRTASAAMYWGKLLAGTIAPDRSRFAAIENLLSGAGNRKTDPEMSRLLDAVKISRRLMEK